MGVGFPLPFLKIASHQRNRLQIVNFTRGPPRAHPKEKEEMSLYAALLALLRS